MKQYLPYIALCSAAFGLLAGCAPGKHAGKTITGTPSPYVLTPDSANRVEMDMLFHIPQRYFSRRSRLVITPQLLVEDTIKEEYMPLIADAPVYDKKLERLKVLDNYTDPQAGRAMKLKSTAHAFDLPYNDTLQLPWGTDNARIIAVVSADGCGECSGIDTIDIAAISNPTALIDEQQIKESLHLSWIEPEFVIRPKVMEGRGVAHLQFAINRSDINLATGNNERELNSMLKKLSPILGDTLATVNAISVTGMSSADGSLALNTKLARSRAASAREWFIRQLSIGTDVQRKITVGARPEGWQPVLAAMTADRNPDSTAVKEILTRYADSDDDVQERYIRRLPCWNQIKDKYLQKDRKVEYVYTYTLKSFTTDAELLDMYRKRPDAFNEDELLRVAALTQLPDAKQEVYETIMQYFPQSQVAANNLAVLYLNAGRDDEAHRVLGRLAQYSPETLNTLAASYIYAHDYEKAIELLQQSELPEARYNLGLLEAQRRRLSEAYKLLRPFADVNSAITALSLNRNEEARTMLAALKDEKPITEYVRSMTAARFREDSEFYRHIGNACTDGKLRRRAAVEAYFYPYHEQEEFRTLIQQPQSPK